MTLVGTYNSGWPMTATELATTEPFPLVATGPRNGERYRNYGALDLRVARDWLLPNSYLSGFVELTNLTNRRNPCCEDYEVEDVNEDGNLVWSLDKKRSFPAVPNIGVVWRFGPGAGRGR